MAAHRPVLAAVDRSGGPDACWPWLGYVNEAGYGRWNNRQAHEAVYEELVGPVPDGLELDHLCRRRDCCNPGHLEAVTHRENVVRGVGFAGTNARKTECPAGHPYDRVSARGARRCGVCRNEQARAAKQRRRERELVG